MSSGVYDILIVGGGLVGASMARALAGQPIKVGLVEAVPFKASDQPSYDERAIALAFGSRRIFEGMGLWDAMASSATPIRGIHVSDRGHFGATRMRAEEEGVDALGYVIENRIIGGALMPKLDGQENLEVLCPARLEHVRMDGEFTRVDLQLDGETRHMTARLVVAADGGKSLVREQLGIGAHLWQYGQTAVISTVTPSRPHGNVAYERFTSSGPLALLPMSDNRCSLVLTVKDEEAPEVLALDDEAFLALLHRRFGTRLGRFERAAPRKAYPLALIRAREHVRPRLALIGNAAHTLHPIAGQGFNLGIRDVAVLAQVVSEAVAAGKDPGDPAVLKRYAKWRQHDQLRVMAFTDGVARVFTNPLPPLVAARNIGLVALDLLPGVKQRFTRYTMGMGGHLPRLARGLPL